ncbi:MAG: NADH-quinone oxidoreductase subunit L [Myxococcales bacterium]|nr:NADH-quinone oxidoreductase subunit L [Myxococcales bacterium]
MPEYSGPVTHVELAPIPLWLIALLPFVGAALNAVFGRKLQSWKGARSIEQRWHIGSFGVTAVAVGAMAGAFALALVNFVALWQLPPEHRYLYSHAWQMVRIGSLEVSFAFAMDPLSAVMTLVITGVGGLIHVYAAAYMQKEPSYWRFFTYLNLFVFAMLLLVLGDGLIVMFFGWEGVGLCSYLLIGFWYKDYKKATAGMKAFVVNRVGDFGVVCGMALLFWGLGGKWFSDGEYLPDTGPRFVAVSAEAGAEHTGAAAGEHASAEAAEGEPAAAPQPRPKGVTDPGEIRARLGKTALLSFTSHPGAMLYLGVSTVEQIEGQRFADCGSLPAWRTNTDDDPAISPRCVATSPFVNKRIPAGVTTIAIVPGDGAGLGTEGSLVRLRVSGGDELTLVPIGSTLTFREIHDQLVIRDGEGRAAVREGFLGKKVWGVALVTLICLFLFVGATGKSAQIPLYTWLPDAMAGPTPVSALIHAATMVTAGVYMIARLNFLFSMSTFASGVVAFVGALTALFAATIGFFQYDIKKVLAYSTVSQLGFMFIGVGVGAYWAGVFHLMTHAFFKACLFLGSGSVIHGMHAVEHDEVAVQDMRNMGGLGRRMRWTARTYFVACLAITAAPIPFFAGFWSKDEILWQAFNTGQTGRIPGMLIYGMGLVAALCTSFYMWRSYFLTFTGQHAKPEIETKVHESPGAITGVLVTLALLSTVAGAVFGLSGHFLGQHAEPVLEHWLHPVTAHAEVVKHHGSLALEYGLMALSVGGALASFFLAWRSYGPRRRADWAEREARLPLFKVLHNKYYVDEIYQATVVRAFMALRLWLAELDRWIVDGLVNAAGVATRLFSWVAGAVDSHVVDGAVNVVAEGTLKAGGKLRTLQTGRVQNYVYGILGGIVLLAVLQYFLG